MIQKANNLRVLVESIRLDNGGGLVHRGPHYVLYPDEYNKLLQQVRDLEKQVVETTVNLDRLERLLWLV
jgi:hypothetical protein